MLSHMRDTRQQAIQWVQETITTQRDSGDELRRALDTCLEEGMSWREIGAAVGIPFQTLQRQYAKGGPIILQAGAR